ncbi:MAG: biotin/lipoate A/B protein ligase family protein [Candidatus Velamenicoccus archaeovorus]
MKTFRLITSGYADAATNMAVDEALFFSYRKNGSLPILRLYGWRPAAFSFGVSQDPATLFNFKALEACGTAMVRRPTGGGALFHNDELTYCIVASTEDLGLETRGVKASYGRITSFLIEAYRILGLEACFAGDNGVHGMHHKIADLCSSRNEEYDILIDGRKLGGSAQKRAKNIILQHGSIPLSFDCRRPKGCLRHLLPDVADLSTLLKRRIAAREISEAVTSAFTSHFSAGLLDSVLDDSEQRLALFLKDNKYATESWNIRKIDPMTGNAHAYRTQAAMA